jgi:hypothetical protein
MRTHARGKEGPKLSFGQFALPREKSDAESLIADPGQCNHLEKMRVIGQHKVLLVA